MSSHNRHSFEELELLIGNSAKARWAPGRAAATGLEELSRMMIETDIRRVERGVAYR
tara:strand:+ start:360 stop:530 length:171 start_codon:yes stop_codon:yes gene_type:complete